MSGRRIAVSSLLVILAVGSLVACGGTSRPAVHPDLARCDDLPAGTEGRCGAVTVPQDRDRPGSPTLEIGFEWYPATGGATNDTLLGVDGGPGYSTTASRSTYLNLLGSGKAHRNLLLVDLRGTGRSTPIDCPALQNFSGADRAAYLDAVAECGRSLGPASDSYSTAAAVEDVIAVLDRLGLDRVDFYGLSYGTWFGQVLASRHPERLRSVTLDSAYPVHGIDPFFLGNLRDFGPAFDRACARARSCRESGAEGWPDIVAMIEKVRAEGVDGVDVPTLLSTISGAGDDLTVYHDLIGASRALVHHEDPVPLQRLLDADADGDAGDGAGSAGGSGPVRVFSSGLFAATVCTDYPHPFDPFADRAARERQLTAAVAALPPPATAPFSSSEWVYAQPGERDALTIDTCLGWPQPHARTAPLVRPAPIVPADLPVLVLSGDLDTNTSPADAEAVLAGLGPGAHRLISVPHAGHVTASGASGNCVSTVISAFLRTPDELDGLPTGCLTELPEIRVVGSYPVNLELAAPATPTAGSSPDVTSLRLAAVAVATAGDALYRYQHTSQDQGSGLRGGKWQAADDSDETRATLDLTEAKWVNDAAVSGRVTQDRSGGEVSATVDVTGTDDTARRFILRWSTTRPDSPATIASSDQQPPFAATTPAP